MKTGLNAQLFKYLIIFSDAMVGSLPAPVHTPYPYTLQSSHFSTYFLPNILILYPHILQGVILLYSKQHYPCLPPQASLSTFPLLWFYTFDFQFMFRPHLHMPMIDQFFNYFFTSMSCLLPLLSSYALIILQLYFATELYFSLASPSSFPEMEQKYLYSPTSSINCPL